MGRPPESKPGRRFKCPTCGRVVHCNGNPGPERGARLRYHLDAGRDECVARFAPLSAEVISAETAIRTLRDDLIRERERCEMYQESCIAQEGAMHYASRLGGLDFALAALDAKLLLLGEGP